MEIHELSDAKLEPEILNLFDEVEQSLSILNENRPFSDEVTSRLMGWSHFDSPAESQILVQDMISTILMIRRSVFENCS